MPPDPCSAYPLPRGVLQRGGGWHFMSASWKGHAPPQAEQDGRAQAGSERLCLPSGWPSSVTVLSTLGAPAVGLGVLPFLPWPAWYNPQGRPNSQELVALESFGVLFALPKGLCAAAPKSA